MVFGILSTSITICAYILSTRGVYVKNLSICVVDNKKHVENLSTASFVRGNWRKLLF